jgi:release factor H-coupled RctB family protein
MKQFLANRHIEPTYFDATALGTIGGGNHFAELQEIEEVVDQEEFEKLGLNKELLYLLVHSGSRSFGYSILDQHLDKFGQKGYVSKSKRNLECTNELFKNTDC